MINIIFESHATTFDNETRTGSGWYDVELSPLGVEQAKQLGERYKKKHIDLVFCSDLQRSFKTAQIAFGTEVPIKSDIRLRECNYGVMTRQPMSEIEKLKEYAILHPFPEGESYKIACDRIRSFLDDIRNQYDGKTIIIVGHRATQYGLDVYLRGLPLKEAILAPWKWQPGWNYKLS